MHIALLYPPPWEIPLPDKPPDPDGQGPPRHLDTQKCLTGDIQNIPYGLLSLAAQALKDGHQVTVLNLFTFSWPDITRMLENLAADIYGLSCFSSNRRGTLSLARLIRRIRPRAHITVGGPHASALPSEMLTHCEALDSVVIGEGEETFRDLVDRISREASLSGLAGCAWQQAERVEMGPPRLRIKNLDDLAVPCDYFNEYILITSRGCPWNCTFCASACIWGRQHTSHSFGSVLDMLEKIVRNHGQRAIAIKDETFTADRRRVLDLCRGISQRGLNFLWSCDTRADVLDEEMLAAMRRAGCQRISLGVESASPDILKTLDKKISPSMVRQATAIAKQFGFQVRFYMIVGSRGETLQTLQENIDFVRAVKPTEAVFSPFTLFPGTREFELAEQRGQVNAEQFFTEDFFELNPLLSDTENPDARALTSWMIQNAGVQDIWDYSVPERETILEKLPEVPAARLDLAQACLREGDAERAGALVQEARERGYPLEGIIENYLACIAARQGRLEDALQHLIKAREHGFYQVVENNIQTAQRWIESGGPHQGQPMELCFGHKFEVTRPKAQPTAPGKIALSGAQGQELVFRPVPV